MTEETTLLDEKDEPSITLRPITSGVGFHKSFSVNKNSSPPLPDFLLQDQLDFEDKDTYKKILSSLENPTWEVPTRYSDPIAQSLEKPKFQPTLKADLSLKKAQDFLIPDTSDSKSSIVQKSLLPPVLGKVFSFKSIFIDGLMVSLLFFPLFLFFVYFTQAQFLAVLSTLWFETLIVFILFSQIYCLLCRLFCFETYGEYISHRRLCKSSSSNRQMIHPMRFFWRFIVCSLTGVIPLPLLSLFFRIDLLGTFTGLRFYKTTA